MDIQKLLNVPLQLQLLAPCALQVPAPQVTQLVPAWAVLLERGGPEHHFSIYLVLEAPFSLRHRWRYLPLEDTLTRTIPLANGSAEPFLACNMKAGSKLGALPAFATGVHHIY